jgi:hypothetical protein
MEDGYSQKPQKRKIEADFYSNFDDIHVPLAKREHIDLSSDSQASSSLRNQTYNDASAFQYHPQSLSPTSIRLNTSANLQQQSTRISPPSAPRVQVVDLTEGPTNKAGDTPPERLYPKISRSLRRTEAEAISLV